MMQTPRRLRSRRFPLRGEPMRKEELDGEQVFVIHDFLSPAECAEYIRLTEGIGYGGAPITTAAGPLMRPDVRNNDRVMVDNPAWAAELWERARPLIPSPFPTRHPEHRPGPEKV